MSEHMQDFEDDTANTADRAAAEVFATMAHMDSATEVEESEAETKEDNEQETKEEERTKRHISELHEDG